MALKNTLSKVWKWPFKLLTKLTKRKKKSKRHSQYTDNAIFDMLYSLSHSLGCDNCRVLIVKLQHSEGIYISSSKETLSNLYRGTFDDPKFNPRWLTGTADYTEIVEYFSFTE